MDRFLEYLYCLIYCLSLTYVVTYLTSKKFINKRVLLSLPIYALVNYIITGSISISFWEYMLVNSLAMAIDTIYICWLVQNTKKENIFYSTIYILLYLFSINSIIHLVNLFIEFNRQSTLIASIERTIMVIAINLITVIIIVLMKKYDILPNSKTLSTQPVIFILLNITVYYAMMIIYNIGVVKVVNLVMALVLILLILWGIFMKVLSLYVETGIKNEELIMEEMASRYISKYIEFYKNESDNLKRIKHDLKNHKEVLETVDKLNNYNEYIDNIFGDINRLDYIQTGNIFIDACLYTKRQEYPDIDFDYDISIENLNINGNDIASLLFNLIDNACHEAMKTDKKVTVIINYVNKWLKIKVINKYLSKPNFISKKGEKHGYGLKIINSIVAKYNGELIIDYINDNVRFNIEIIIL